MWNLFCRLSVNKLCGSLQAAYLTFSVHFPHTGSITLTRAVSWGYSQAKGQGPFSLGQQKPPWSYSQQPPQTFSVNGCWRAPLFLTPCMARLCSFPYFLIAWTGAKLKILCVCSSTIHGVKTGELHIRSMCLLLRRKTTPLCVCEQSSVAHTWTKEYININIHIQIDRSR